MLKQMIIDQGMNLVTTDIVEELSEIDLNKDVVIVYKSSKHNNEVSFDLDQFNISTIENLKPINSKTSNITKFSAYTRIKMMLPLGIVPFFESELTGIKVKDVEYNKRFGIDVDISLETKEQLLRFKNISDSETDTVNYVVYDNIKLDMIIEDQTKFNKNAFIGMIIPGNTTIASFKLFPHYISCPFVQHIYLICSSYLYDRVPNM